MDLTVVVLAAGQGTRMKSSKPKVLHPIGGKPMLVHVVKTAQALNPAQILVVHGFGGELLQQALQAEKITWVEQATQQGTGDAVAKALPFIPPSHRVLILYGDVPLIRIQTLQKLLQDTPENQMGMLTVNTENPTGLGRIVRDHRGAIQQIVEERDANENQRHIKEVNVGVFVLPAALLARWLPRLNNQNAQNEYYLSDMVQFALDDVVDIATFTVQSANEVLGVNDRAQQVAAERCYQQQCAQHFLQQGVWIADPARFDLRGSLQAAPEVMIDVNVVLEGEVLLREGCSIGPHCTLINCDIGENVTILAHCYLEGVKIAAGAKIGPFARLRPGTVLGNNVHVGNFVEIKNSRIEAGSKINHLSYIGDTTMGKSVNIGAGTITCNYDGANKHRTIIEDDVHIGSDTQLIAPVRVGKGATLGAGTTLTQDAPPEKLTVTQQIQQRSKSWQRPNKDEE